MPPRSRRRYAGPRPAGSRPIRLDAPNRGICPSCKFPARINEERPASLARHDAGSGGECPASGWYRCLACSADPTKAEFCRHCAGRGWSPGVSGYFELPGGRRRYIAHGPLPVGYVRVDRDA